MALKRVLLKPITLCVLLGLSSSALANVVINIPSEVDVLAANGQEAEIEGGFSQALNLSLYRMAKTK